MMYYNEWLQEDYEQREIEFNFTQSQLDKMYKVYIDSFLE